VGDQEEAKLRAQLIALIRRGRPFAHHGTSLHWYEVRRLKTEGCRRLSQVYGDNSPQEEYFTAHLQKAFFPLYTWKRNGRVDK